MHHHISSWYKNYQSAKILHELFSSLGDIPRIAQQITQKKRMISSLRQLANQITHIHQDKKNIEALIRYDEQVLRNVDLFIVDIKNSLQEEVDDENNRLAE